MSRRSARALTLVLLGLLIAAPLSSGDKGLWLSLTSTPLELFAVAAGRLPVEHAILVPERASQAGRADATARPDAVRSLGPAGAQPPLGSGYGWTLPDAAPLHPHGEPLADHPAPRAPPA